MKKLRKILSGLRGKFIKLELPVREFVLSGQPIRAVKGTIRPVPDKDDAWLFWLMGHFQNIYDIGANIGQSALMAKVQDADKRLLLVDPNPEALVMAFKNLILNGWIGHCQLECAFVSHQSGEHIPFYTVGVGAAGSMFKGHAQTAAALGSSYLVPTITIDDLYHKYGWLPEFIKIDVEGAEAQVLKGAVQVALEQKTWFMVEMHSPPELPMTQNAALVLDWVRRCGYEAWYMRDACRLTDPAMLADRGRCHLLLLPQGVAYPPELAQIPENSPLPAS